MTEWWVIGAEIVVGGLVLAWLIIYISNRGKR